MASLKTVVPPASSANASSLPASPRSGQLTRLPDAVRQLRVSRSTIYSWMKQGIFPKNFPIGPRATAWLQSDIDAFVAARATQNNAEVGHE